MRYAYPAGCAGCGAATRQLPTYANFHAIETHPRSLTLSQYVGVCELCVCVRMRMQNPGNVAQFAPQEDPKRRLSTTTRAKDKSHK